ncbi:MAG: Holliday junction resolvase RuvX [Microbacteriaceae bacterium]|nr:Holliday junction resolvase RuvX [Microbacteriaceae bacterium]
MFGVRLGIDVGKARVGVSRCDPLGTLAVPVETVPRTTALADAAENDQNSSADLAKIAEIAAEYGATGVFVGLPLNMQGEATLSTADAEHFAQKLAIFLAETGQNLPVRLVDERLSTVTAQAQLHQAGRNTKRSRQVIDQAAACIILQHAIDSEQRSGKNAGKLVEITKERE